MTFPYSHFGLSIRLGLGILSFHDGEMRMPSTKERIAKILQDHPDDSSYEENLRKLVLTQMVEGGLADSDAGRTINHEEMECRIKTWWN